MFLSGHTHISPNSDKSCGEWDSDRNNLYYNAGSICPTTVKTSWGIEPDFWSDGVVTELIVGKNNIEVKAKSINDGRIMSRGFYILEKTNFKYKK